MFTVMNYLLPKQGVLSMHCSANIGAGRRHRALLRPLGHRQDDAVRRSASASLIGDDEHGWSRRRHVQLRRRLLREGRSTSPPRASPTSIARRRCSAPCSRTSCSTSDAKVKFEDQSITENTRASYPLHYIPNHVPSGRGGHPKNIIFLTADAFGVLPPIARLTREQAMYYFLSGYTAKVAGTERGVTEPQATFSACFGAVFLVWHPTKYAEMLGELLRRARLERLAGEHRLERRRVRRRQAHEARRTRARWCTRRSSATLDGIADRHRSGLRLHDADGRARTCRPRSWIRAARGPTGRRTTRRRRSSPRCSAKNFEKFGSVGGGDQVGWPALILLHRTKNGAASIAAPFSLYMRAAELTSWRDAFEEFAGVPMRVTSQPRSLMRRVRYARSFGPSNAVA